MVEGQKSFHEFEKLLEKERLPVYPEEYNHVGEVAVGFVIASVGITLFVIMDSFSIALQIIGLFLLPIGVILCCIGLILNQLGRRKYQFRGLSRTALSAAVMYLDSIVVRPEELESPAPYHDKVARSSFELSKLANGFVKFVNRTTGSISWPSGFISDTKTDFERIRRRLAFLPICAILLSLLLLTAMYSILASESTTLAVLGVGIGYLGLYSLVCIARSFYEYAQVPKFGNSEQLVMSSSQKLEDTLSDIFTLLQTEYTYPLRFHMAGAYSLLEYTGRTKTSYSLVRLKEAVLYPRTQVV